MAGHRNAIVFRPTQPTINVTRKFVKPQAAKTKPSIFAMPMPTIAPMQMPMLQGIAKLNEQPKPIEVKPEEEITKTETDTDIDTDLDTDTDTDTDTDPVRTDPREYDYDKDPGNTTRTIQAGDTWWALADTLYEGTEGIPKNLLGRYLAAANSTKETPEERLAEAKNGIIFFPGQIINLPSEININGKTIRLKENHAELNVLNKNTKFDGKGTHLNIKITQVGPTWFITENGQAIDDVRYTSEEEAKAKVKELNDAARAAVSSGTGTVSGDKAA